MKLYVLGFEPRARIRYPHLKQVIDRLPAGTRYLQYRERGYFLGRAISGARDAIAALRDWWWVAVDSARLALARAGNADAVVLAVDNFAYVVASLLFDNVILWSHDFLTDDVDRSRSRIQRLLKQSLASALRRNGAIVIQDHDRLRLFQQTYLEGGAIPDVFLLPVSLAPVVGQTGGSVADKPVLMQIGGINAWRSCSDRLLEHFQHHGHAYRLAFNGFLDAEMRQAIEAAGETPIVQPGPVPPDQVHLAVASCDIGFIAYNADNLNFFHVARASGQLVEFLRCGKPVIVLGRSTLADVAARERFGVCIDGFEELDLALRTILADYQGFSTRALAAFSSTYNLDAHMPGLVAWLQSRREA